MLETLRKRRSIRKYQDRPIEPELVEQLKEAVLRAPTSNNCRPWRFVFVTDPDVRERLSRAKSGPWGLFLADAPLGVVISAEESVTDVWIEDCSIAAIVLQLTATTLGLGSCWIQIRGRSHDDGRPAEEHVREILELAPELRVEAMIAIGYPAEDKPERPRDGLKWDAIEER